MNEVDVLAIGREAMILTLKISGPVMLAGMVVGLIIALVQALTSIQEMTLTFVPKAGLMLVVFWVSMSFMTTTLVAFFTDTIVPRIAGG